MHDIRLIRENPDAFDAALARRGVAPATHSLLALDGASRAALTAAQNAQAAANSLAASIGALMAQGKREEAEAAKVEAKAAKEGLPALEAAAGVATKQLHDVLAALPNLPADDVPNGLDESGNVELKRWGTPRDFDFTPLEHADLGPSLGLDFETGAKMSGARFTFLRGQMARLERALGQFMLDMQTGAGGYTECATPLIANGKALFGTGQLPKFGADLYSVQNEYSTLQLQYLAMKNQNSLLEKENKFLGEINEEIGQFSLDKILQGFDMSGLAQLFKKLETRFSINTKMFGEFANQFMQISNKFLEMEKDGAGFQQFLIPTSEVSLTNAVMGDILSESALPMRMTALTPCFRSEAGAAGRDTRGYIRQHQFWKVELVSITRPEDSDAELERKVTCAEAVLEALHLPYRRMILCAGDMGAGARKTFDLEVWLPGQNSYREISSCSNCGEFQARRMNTRYRPDGEKATRFVHTLNGSGLAVGRTLVAVLENYQNADGSVTVPDALLPYMGGITVLTP